jgi:pentatricopeptide repeat protein
MAAPISLPSIPHPPTLLHSKLHSSRKTKPVRTTRPFEEYKNQVIRLAERGQLDSAVKTLKDMPFKPDLVSFSVLLRTCIREKDLHHGRAVHQLLLSSGLELDTAIFNSLITMYSKGGDYNTAYSIFTKLGIISSVLIFLSGRIAAVVDIMCEKNCVPFILIEA